MKINYLVKSVPFISTLFLIIFLCISNQRVNTKLRILIWNTPSYSLGTYMAISTGTGFILSYILTTSLININSLKSNKSLNNEPDDSNPEYDDYANFNSPNFNEKTLFERDINDPSPTVNAKFRVIGIKERYKTNYDNSNSQYYESNDSETEYFEDYEKSETINQEKGFSSDWNDDSFSTW